MTKEEIQKIYDYSKSKQDIIRKLNINPNQNGINLDKNILKYFSIIGIQSKNDLKISNLKKHWLEIQKRDYELNPKYCLNCGNKLPFEKRFSKCCNQSCANSYSNKKRGSRSEKTKEKISESLKKFNKIAGNNNISERISYIKKFYNNELSYEYIKKYKPEIIKICKECGKSFIPLLQPNGTHISGNKFCSKECHNLSISKQMKELRKKEIEAGTFQGWKSRNIISYPEKFWTKVLENNKIEFIPNKPVKQENNMSCYFLDFYIEKNGRKIDLEIDGKQHKYKDRQESDKKRDKYLKLLGYEVYRIEWNAINKKSGKELMKEKIYKFIKYYNNINDLN